MLKFATLWYVGQGNNKVLEQQYHRREVSPQFSFTYTVCSAESENYGNVSFLKDDSSNLKHKSYQQNLDPMYHVGRTDTIKRWQI